MSLSQKLSKYDKDFWNFSGYRNNSQFVRYPAVMVAPMQATILKEIINIDKSVKSVFDPFFGSGTVLQEGAKLGLDVLGFDINPLAELIAKVRLEGIPRNKAEKSIKDLEARITMLNGNVPKFHFNNITKWFNDDIICSLSVIRQAIIEEPNKRIRRYLWCSFAETVKQYSNTRTSTFKLHIKDEQAIKSVTDDSIYFFKYHAKKHLYSHISKTKNYRNIDIRCGNSSELIRSIPCSTIDLICTSPPYGDNHTTVTYGQYSILPLLWIDRTDLQIWKHDLLDNFSSIDSASLGGRVSNYKNCNHNYHKYVKNVSDNKQAKIISFFNDYEEIFSLLSRVLKPGKLMILTLGNRRVDNKEIRFDLFNDALATKYGLKLNSTLTRNIVGKRIPSLVSKIGNIGPVPSIGKEYVKIYIKES